ALKNNNPEAIIYCNANGLIPPRATGRDNRSLAEHVDILAAEGGFIFYIQPNLIPVWKPGAAAKLLETQASGKPRVIFLCGNHKPWDCYALPGTETELMFAQTAANGASPWYAILKDNLKTEGAVAATKMLEILERLEDDLTGTSSAAKVALVWSQSTEDYYGTGVDYSDFTASETKKDVHGHSQEAFNGYYEALVRAHIPFDVIDDISLTDGTLSRYRMVLLPNTACMCDEAAGALRAFVKSGGNLLASFAASLYDYSGTMRKDFALSDVFGLSYADKILGTFDYDYVATAKGSDEILGPMQEPLPAPPNALAVRVTTAKPLLMLYEKLSARYIALPPVSEYPAMTVNTFGKGKAFYLASDADQFYWTHRIPEHLQWLTSPVLNTVTQQVRIGNVPQTVELIVRRQGENKLLIHLINFTGNMHRPITEIVSLSNIEIRFEGLRPKRVKALISQKELAVIQSPETLTVTLPYLDCYEVISCEY
ncbi:MAG: beta-galactosidase trimerization domain-containing protein, partial [Spirochaetales bacterium]|nr:beta-galactosidase trimerization domain-containing protein [Spirochaetales bacterium]